MRKILSLILFLTFLFGILYYFKVLIKKNNQQESSKAEFVASTPKPTNSILRKVEKEDIWLFIPYWSISSNEIDSKDFSKLIYFSVNVNDKGINDKGAGFSGIKKFITFSSQEKEKILTLQMTDFDSNSKILKDKNLQIKIIKDTINIAKQNSFDGVVLDFETQGLAFESFVNNISDFYLLFSKEVKSNNFQFYVTIYGDVFYRGRPYDVEKIAKNTDGILIMAYDFHKARGNPGPNFPLNGADEYGYDFKMMINDYLKVVPKEKLIIIFGLYGYDWHINEKKQTVENGEALSINKIKEKFLDNCNFKKCVIERDDKSSETRINYIDEENQQHVIWFEDMKSVSEKRKYLKEVNINSIGFWAYSYF